MFLEFINQYGMSILYTVVTAIAGYVGIVVKNLYEKYMKDRIKKDVAKTVVQFVEQVYKNIHGEDKLNKALESASEMLMLKGIEVSDFEMRLLIEAAVGEFNDAFKQETAVEVEGESNE